MARKSQAEQAEHDDMKAQRFDAPSAKAPSILSGRSLEIWEEILPILKQAGFATEIESHHIARYCSAIAIAEKAQMDIDAEGLTLHSARGGPKLNPSLTALNQANKVIRDFMNDFGLTPSSRGRVKFDKKKKDNPFSKLKRGASNS